MKKRKIFTLTGMFVFGVIFISSCDSIGLTNSNVISTSFNNTSSKVTSSNNPTISSILNTTTSNNTVSTTTSGNSVELNNTILFYNTCGASLQSEINKAISSFESKYPKWNVKSVQIGGYDDVYDYNISSLDTQSQCNISYCYSEHVANYITHNTTEKKYILDINQYIASDEFINGYKIGYTEEEVSDFVEAYYNDGKALNFANYEKYGYESNSMLTLPFGKLTEVMYGNLSALKNAGITDNLGNAKIPQTWDELWEACEILKKKYPNSTPLSYDSESNWIINMCKQNGWNYTSTSEPYYDFKDDSNLANWMDLMYEKVKSGLVTTQTHYGSYTSDLFDEGANEGCVFCIASSGGANYYHGNFEIGISPIPGTLKSDWSIDNSVIVQGPSLCMFDCGNEEKNLMSWLFLKELLEPEFQADFSIVSGYNPCRLSTFSLDEYLNHLVGGKNYQVCQLLCTTITESYFTNPAFIGSNKASKYIAQAFIDTTKGLKSGKNALLDAYNNCIKN